MIEAQNGRPLRRLRQAGCTILLALLGAVPAHADSAATLKARHAALQDVLNHNVFGQPLHLESKERGDVLEGEIYAVIAQPYATVGPALGDLHQWCDILILHLNVKACRTTGSDSDARLQLNVGRKFDQSIDDTYALDFTGKRATSGTDYLQLRMNAAAGPLGTRDYRIVLEVVALDAQRSFLHLAYAYRSSASARTAMRAYLATLGRDKQGFSIVGKKADGSPRFIGGTRGAIERNTMRYYLAIEAYLGALSVPAPQRLEKRLSDWHDGVERYPAQLHDLERDEYLTMKRREVQRLQEQPATS